MNLWKVVGLWACALVGLIFSSQAQIIINGVTDRSTYTDTATFNVVPLTGYTDTAFLNGDPVPVGVNYTIRVADYYDLIVTRQNDSNPTDVTQRLLRFIVRSAERSSTEDGLPPWTPYPAINSASNEFSGAQLRIVTPQDYPLGLEIPVVAWVMGEGGHAVRVNGWLADPGQPSIQIRRGVGSGFLPSASAAGPLNFSPRIGGLQTNKVINLEANTTWTSVSGTLSGAVEWPENSRIAITNHVIVTSGATLTIGAGTVVRVGAGIDITNNGLVTINGTIDRPVVFTPANRSQPWGGFIQHANNAQFTATGAIFTGSGAYQGCWFTGHGCSTSVSGIGSHRGEQALISLRGANCNLTLTDCAAIHLAGQFAHSASGGSYSYAITLNRFLMQRCTTGGEYTGALFKVNDSAFIECAEDLSTGESPEFVDGDNDALYIVNGPSGQFHGFTNSLIGWTKDDGVDSGGDGAARLIYEGCWFESTFHEGNSLSGAQNASPHADKDVLHHNGVFLGCGQAVEDGYGAPTGRVDHCLIIGGMTGSRFGDNYNWQYYGFLQTTNSILLHNHRDVWGVNFQDWTYRTSAMDIQGNWLTAANTNHPNNAVWNPATDGSALADFLTIPADSQVGVAFATWKTQFPMDEVTNSIPVGLSTFTTHPVRVDYTIESPGGILESGTLDFTPGEIIKRIQPSPAVVTGHDQVRVVLRQAVQGELTGPSQILFAKTASAPGNTTFIAAGSEWKYNDLGGDQGIAWRAPAFDDSSWSNGVAQLGFGDSPRDETTLIRRAGTNGQNTITFYFRRAFSVSDPGAMSTLNLWLLRDDGGGVYLNGNEVFRSDNMPLWPAPISYLTLADLTGTAENTVDTATLNVTNLVAGINVAAVEIHQHDNTSSDVSFDFSLTGVPSTRPRLDLARFSDGWVLWWSDETAVLESADTVNGAWSLVPGARSPFAMTQDEAQKFYRLRKP